VKASSHFIRGSSDAQDGERAIHTIPHGQARAQQGSGDWSETASTFDSSISRRLRDC
jgi:hypothetical protein